MITMTPCAGRECENLHQRDNPKRRSTTCVWTGPQKLRPWTGGSDLFSDDDDYHNDRDGDVDHFHDDLDHDHDHD